MDALKFAEVLDSRDVGYVLDHVDRGLSKTHRAQKFILSLCSNKRKELEATSELVNEEFKALRSDLNTAESSEKPWKTFLAQQQKDIKGQQLLIENLLEQVCLPLRKFHSAEIIQFKSLERKFQEANENMRSCLKELERRKVKSVKAIQSVQSKDSNKLFSDMKGTTWPKVYQLCRLYDEQLNAANLLCQTYHDVEMPKIMRGLQIIEEKRIAMSKIAFVKGIEVSRKYHTESTLNIDLESLLGRLSVKDDISKFIEDAQHTSNNREAFPRIVTFDLPLRLKDVEEQANVSSYSSTKKAPIDLQSTPEKILADQKRMFPDLNLSLPRIFLMFKRAIEDLGGLEREGIFRVSSNFTEVDRVYSSIVCGNYEVEFDDPHVAAQCLKKWLREMQEPLFPSSSNGKIIDALSMLTTDVHFAETCLLQIFKELSTVRQLVIKGVIRIMRDIAFPDNIKINKMSISNLCVVFAPSFMRCEEATADPMIAFKVAQSAAQALEVLARVVDVRDYPADEEIIAASPFVTPVQSRNFWKRAPLFWSDEAFKVSKSAASRTNSKEGVLRLSKVLDSEVETASWDEEEYANLSSIRRMRQAAIIDPEAFEQIEHCEGDEEEETKDTGENAYPFSRRDRVSSTAERQCNSCHAITKNGKFCFQCWTPLD